MYMIQTMYAKINIIKELEPNAEKFIIDNDRMMYRPFFETVEKFCAEKSVLIGGRVGIDLLVGRELNKDSFSWELYCDDTFKMATELANELAATKSPHIPARTTALQTNIKYKEFTISINARMLFKIYNMDKYRGIKLADLMGPAIRSSYFLKIPIKCIAEEMQLIEIYRTLYSPSKLSMWAEELENEDKIYTIIKDTLGEKSVQTGTQLNVQTNEMNGGDEITQSVKQSLKSIQDILLRKVISNKNAHEASGAKNNSVNVLIGDHAMSIMGLTTATRVQFISSSHIDDIVKSCERSLRNDLRAVKSKSLHITYVKYPLNIPNDFQITKYTLYANDGKEQIAIADVFNSSAFEMIPFTTHGKIHCGKPWVLLRFIFIDIWVLKIILNLKADNPEFIKSRIQTLLSLADKLRIYVKTDIAKSFQLTNYAGVYISETVAKKKLIKELGERFPIYYPARNAVGEGVAGGDTGGVASGDTNYITHETPHIELANTKPTTPTNVSADPDIEISQHLATQCNINFTTNIDIKKAILARFSNCEYSDDLFTCVENYEHVAFEYMHMFERDKYMGNWFVPFLPSEPIRCDLGSACDDIGGSIPPTDMNVITLLDSPKLEIPDMKSGILIINSYISNDVAIFAHAMRDISAGVALKDVVGKEYPLYPDAKTIHNAFSNEYERVWTGQVSPGEYGHIYRRIEV